MMTENQKFGRHIVKAPMEYSVCTGCGSCEIICGLMHEGTAGPGARRIILDHGQSQKRLYRIHSCQHCADHPCYEACPKKDEAMVVDENGIVCITEDACIGCGKCQKACPFNPPRITMGKGSDGKKRKAKKCDLCKDRPEGPACVEYCPAVCLGVSGDDLPWERKEDA